MNIDTSRDAELEAATSSRGTTLDSAHTLILYDTHVVDGRVSALIYGNPENEEYIPMYMESGERIKWELEQTCEAFRQIGSTPTSYILHLSSQYKIEKEFEDLVSAAGREPRMRYQYIPEAYHGKFREIDNSFKMEDGLKALIIVDSLDYSDLVKSHEIGNPMTSRIIIDHDIIGDARKDELDKLSEFIHTTQRSIKEGSINLEGPNLDSMIQGVSRGRYGCIVMTEEEKKVFKGISDELSVSQELNDDFGDRVERALPSISTGEGTDGGFSFN